MLSRWMILIALVCSLVGWTQEPPPPRLYVIPGGADDVIATWEKLKDGSIDDAWWQSLFAKHGSQALRFLVVLSREEAYRSASRDAFHLYLQSVSSRESYEAARSLPKPDFQRLLYLVDMTLLQGLSETDILNLIRTLNDLGEYRRAYSFGHRAWLERRSILVLGHTMRAIREGELVADVWAQAGETLYADPNPNLAALEICFFAEVARALNQAAPIESLLEIAELDGVNTPIMAYLVERLDRLGLRRDIAELLADSHDPVLRYLRIHYVEQREPTAEEWDRIYSQLQEAQEAVVLAETLTRRESPSAALAWRRVLSFDELSHEQRRQAHLRLGTMAEKQLDYQTAVTHVQAALETISVEGDDEQAELQRRSLERYLETLREQAARGSDPYAQLVQQAQIAIAADEFDRAESLCRQAIALQPTRFGAHSMLFSACKLRHDYQRLETIGRVLMRLTPQTSQETLSKIVQLAEIMQLEAALATANTFVASHPQEPGGFLARATVYERLGLYPQALADLETASELGVGPRVHRMRGLVLAKQGQFGKAVESLDRSLSFDDGPYVRLWRHLLQRRLEQPDDDDLAAALYRGSDVDETWIHEVYRFCLGRLDEEGLLAAAVVPGDEGLTRAQLCEAWFYMGYHHLVQNRPRTARRALLKSLEYDIKPFIETPWAKAELERLDGDAD